jgi:hypothetical protein
MILPILIVHHDHSKKRIKVIRMRLKKMIMREIVRKSNKRKDIDRIRLSKISMNFKMLVKKKIKIKRKMIYK